MAAPWKPAGASELLDAILYDDAPAANDTGGDDLAVHNSAGWSTATPRPTTPQRRDH